MTATESRKKFVVNTSIPLWIGIMNYQGTIELICVDWHTDIFAARWSSKDHYYKKPSTLHEYTEKHILSFSGNWEIVEHWIPGSAAMLSKCGLTNHTHGFDFATSGKHDGNEHSTHINGYAAWDIIDKEKLKKFIDDYVNKNKGDLNVRSKN